MIYPRTHLVLKRMFEVSFVLSITLAGCKARRSSIMNADAACSLNNPPSNVDPVVAATQKSCNANVEQMFINAGCHTMGRTFVAEKDIKKARLIDVFQCSDPQGHNMDQNTVFFSHPDELIAFDQVAQVHNFYKLENGSYNFQGNSFSENNPCLECHVNGAMVMKELVIPWPHWPNEIETEETYPIFGEDVTGNHREPIPGFEMEGFTRQSIASVATSYARKVKTGESPLADTTLRDVLRPLFCDAEVTLADGIKEAPTGDGTLLFLGNQMFMPDQLLLAEGRDYGISNDLLPEIPGNDVEEAFGRAQGLSEVIGLIVSKSASDLGYIDALKAEGMISEELILSARMTDYMNPIHSIRRCEVLKHVPETKFSSLKTAEAVTKNF
jgi:hypothetical protein